MKPSIVEVTAELPDAQWWSWFEMHLVWVNIRHFMTWGTELW